jgi:hypothetical protein
MEAHPASVETFLGAIEDHSGAMELILEMTLDLEP